MVCIAESKAPRKNRKVLDPIGIPIKHVTVNLHRALHRLLNDLHVRTQLLTLNEIDLELIGSSVVHAFGEGNVLLVQNRANGI